MSREHECLLKFRVDVLLTLNFRDVTTAVLSATLSHSFQNMWSHADAEKKVVFYGECHRAICDTERVNRRISARGKILHDVFDSAASTEGIHQQVVQVRIGPIH